jgi:hypothetical protein
MRKIWHQTKKQWAMGNGQKRLLRARAASITEANTQHRLTEKLKAKDDDLTLTARSLIFHHS